MTKEEDSRVEFRKSRFQAMAQAKQNQQSKFNTIKQLYDIFDDKLISGHKFGDRFRFPKLFSAIQRKKAEILEVLPKTRFNSTFEDKKDSALGANASMAHFENMSNSRREDARIALDVPLYGTGIKFEGYIQKKKQIVPVKDRSVLLSEGEKEEQIVYDGIVSERVDPRDFYVDEAAYVLHDETGQMGARDCIRRKSYPYSAFLKEFEDFKNLTLVVPTGFSNSNMGDVDKVSTHESEDNKDSVGYVHVFEYWNQEEDIRAMDANGIEIYIGSNPYKHKKLPFVVYYNYRRDDSFWGLSEAEILAPFIYSTEVLTNLMITDAEFALQPAMAVDGELQVPKDGLQPGGMLQWRGTSGGKLKDSLIPLRFGGVDQSGPLVKEMIEDEMITTTGDDIRALFANPDQLATQTLAKRESLQKRIRSLIYENTVDGKKQEALLRISNIIQFGTKPILTSSGKVRYRRVKIESFDVHQQDEETEPRFVQRYGAEGYFYLNSKVLDYDSYELEVLPQNEDEIMKKDQLENLMTFLNAYGNILAVAQADPLMSRELLSSVNLVGLMKQITRRFGEFDEDSVYPESPELEKGKDLIDFEHEAILLGFKPPIKPEEDSAYHLERHMNFLLFVKNEVKEKRIPKVVLDTLNLHIHETILAKQEKTIQRVLPPVPEGQGAIPVPLESGGNNEYGTVPIPPESLKAQANTSSNGAAPLAGGGLSEQGQTLRKGGKREIASRLTGRG